MRWDALKSGVHLYYDEWWKLNVRVQWTKLIRVECVVVLWVPALCTVRVRIVCSCTLLNILWALGWEFLALRLTSHHKHSPRHRHLVFCFLFFGPSCGTPRNVLLSYHQATSIINKQTHRNDAPSASMHILSSRSNSFCVHNWNCCLFIPSACETYYTYYGHY